MSTVVYPTQAKTDAQKLACVYNLIEQARLAHNAQGAIARQEGVGEKWVEYTKAFRSRLKLLLHEQNTLRERIRLAHYTEAEWAKLPTELWVKGNIHEVQQSLFGDRQSLKQVLTASTSPVLDGIKALRVLDLNGLAMLDPTEDYTTYTELDPDSDITVTSSKIDVSSVQRLRDAWVYKDKGANHFDGDFEHLVEMYHDTGQWITCAVWAIANKVESIDDWDVDEDALILNWQTFDWTPWIQIREINGGSGYTDHWASPSSATLYYITIERDESVGTYGTLYAYIYSDASRETLEDTLSLTLHTSKKDFRYIFGFNNLGSDGSNSWTGYAQDLDLQEGGATTYTETVSMTALLQKLADTKTVDLDAYLKAVDTETLTVDALLKALDTETLTVDALLRAVDAVKTVNLDMLARALGVTEQVALDVILGLAAEKTVDLDTLLQAVDTEAVDLDLMVQALGVTKTAAIDTLIEAVGLTKAVDLDSYLQGQSVDTVDLDALVKGLGIPKTVALDVLIGAGETYTKAVLLDVFLGQRRTTEAVWGERPAHRGRVVRKGGG